MAKKDHSQNAFEDAIFHWETPEFLQFERNKLWYLIATLLIGALLAYAAVVHAWSFVAMLVILPFALISQHRRKPKKVQVIFSPYGVKFGAREIAYSQLQGFWVFHHPPLMDELHLKTDEFWHSEVVIPLSGINPTLLRQYLLTQIPEMEGKKPRFVDTLIRILRLN